jgi:hypothetical protein
MRFLALAGFDLIVVAYPENICPFGGLQVYDGHCDKSSEYPGR